MNFKIKNALISIPIRKKLSLLKIFKNIGLILLNVGTYKAIKKLGYKCTELSDYTGLRKCLMESEHFIWT